LAHSLAQKCAERVVEAVPAVDAAMVLLSKYDACCFQKLESGWHGAGLHLGNKPWVKTNLTAALGQLLEESREAIHREATHKNLVVNLCPK